MERTKLRIVLIDSYFKNKEKGKESQEIDKLIKKDIEFRKKEIDSFRILENQKKREEKIIIDF